MERVKKLSISWDHVGVVLSFLCLVHCLFLPFLISMLPALGLEIFQNEMIHKTLAVGVCVVSLFAFIPGLRIHQKTFVIFLAALGLLCILGAVLYAGENWGEMAEKGLTSLGGLFLITAHILNQTFCRSCLTCQDDDAHACEAITP